MSTIGDSTACIPINEKQTLPLYSLHPVQLEIPQCSLVHLHMEIWKAMTQLLKVAEISENKRNQNVSLVKNIFFLVVEYAHTKVYVHFGYTFGPDVQKLMIYSNTINHENITCKKDCYWGLKFLCTMFS